MPITLDACVAQHQGDRKEQQDRVAILPHPRFRGTVLVALADGMGGHTGGALAAEQVIHTAKANLNLFAPSHDSPTGLLEATMQEAHTMIKASRFMNEKDPHSTAVLLFLRPDLVCWAHCGDSRLYHFRQNDLISRTVDHSYIEHLIESGRITRDQASTHPGRNILLTSLGGQEAPKFSFSPTVEPAIGDSFVLCSDGIWAYFDDAEMADIVCHHTARQGCELFIERARQRGNGLGDNLSLAVIKLLDGGPAEPKRRQAWRP